MNIAAQDQMDALRRDRAESAARLERTCVKISAWFLIMMTPFLLYGVLAAFGVLPAAPWSGMAQ